MRQGRLEEGTYGRARSIGITKSLTKWFIL
jgi:hypothetical protein